MGIFRNETEGRLRAPWRLLTHGALFVILTMALSPFLPADVQEAGRAEIESMAVGEGLSISTQTLMWWSLVALAAGLLSTWIAATYIDHRRPPTLGLRLDGAWWTDLGVGIALGFVVVGGAVAVGVASGWMEIVGGEPTEAPGFLPHLIVASVAFLSIGIYEEIIIRGYQMTNLAEGLNLRRWSAATAVIAALLLSSVVFGLLHAVNPGYSVLALINITLISILALGLGYAVTGRLGLPIGLHTSWNFALGFVFGLPVSGVSMAEQPLLLTRATGPELWTGGAFGPEGGLLGTAAILAACAALLLWTRRREGDVAIRDHIAEPPAAAEDPQAPRE